MAVFRFLLVANANFTHWNWMMENGWTREQRCLNASPNGERLILSPAGLAVLARRGLPDA